MKRSSEIIYFGFAPSDIANNINPQYRLPEKLISLNETANKNSVGYELELEDNFEEVPVIDERPVFLGVHQPSSNVDVLDYWQKEQSLEKIKRTMAMAHKLNADYFTVHLQTVDRWDDLSNRADANRLSLEVFKHLTQFYSKQNFQYKMYVENLEYPKYPATTEEISEVIDFLSKNIDVPTGVLLDVGHLWRTRNIMSENNFHHEGGDLPFTEYLQNTLNVIGDGVQAMHLTGCGGYKTHLLPQLESEAPNDRQAYPDEYFFRKIARIVLKFGLGKGTVEEPFTFVNEAFGYPYEEVIENCKGIANII
ncbi:sugar phosphate isomerase/epimerase [Candidatus Saccharibacteria bacterium]|nr:sugar phosphate isomerase/epimerase [Candidatus Saccharibacteria bacterium]